MFEDFKNKFIKQNKEKKEQMKKLFLSGKYNIENNKNKEEDSESDFALDSDNDDNNNTNTRRRAV